MSHNNPPVRNAVIAALTQHGPMTCHEIADVMDWPLARVQCALRNARRLHPEKVFRVIRYKPVTEGKGKDASVYAAQAGADVPRQADNIDERRQKAQARYRRRHKAVINSRTRRARALQSGHAVRANPWAQLSVSGGIRSAITYLERYSSAAT